jgi:zinc/manganese transport system substrate-binding protein
VRLLLVLALAAAAAAPEPLRIVAAEAVYADIATQLAPPGTPVTAILANPAQDPHEFEPSPAIARDLAQARLVLANGAGYDPWITPLLAATASPTRVTLIAADLVHAPAGANPHLWCDPATLPAVTRATDAALAAALPAEAAAIAARRDRLLATLQRLATRIAQLRTGLAGTRVAATEPVFGPMAEALGLVMEETRFQRAVMNGTEPAPADVAAFEDDIRAHRIRALLVNGQVTDPAADRLAGLARSHGIPVVAVGEVLPRGQHAQDWLAGEVEAVATALATPHA